MSETIDSNILENLFIPIRWPEVQDLMQYEDFYDNAYLITDSKGFDDFGSSAYFVKYQWYYGKSIIKD